MEEKVFQEKTKYRYSICAVVFGADETILNIKLRDGFRFVKKSIYSKKDGLTNIFQTDVSGLQRNYICAFIYGTDDELGSVACIEKEYEIELKTTESEDYWNKETEKDLQSIDNQIRVIRLFNEGPVRVKQIAFKMDAQPHKTGKIQLSHSFCNLFPFTESYPTNPISMFHCDKNETETLNDMIKRYDFPLEDKILNSAHMYYDLSYHTYPCISITLLTTSLEMLFLNKGDGKKEPLAKRCSSYIGISDEDVTNIYMQLKESYKKRSNFVHDGDLINISESDVLFLREYVRKSILKALDDTETKSGIINRLKEFVDSNQQLFEDKNASKNEI